MCHICSGKLTRWDIIPYILVWFSFINLQDSTGSDDKPPHEQEVLSTESEKSDETQSIYDQNTSSLIPENKNHESTNSFTFIGDSNGTSMETLSFKMKVHFYKLETVFCVIFCIFEYFWFLVHRSCFKTVVLPALKIQMVYSGDNENLIFCFRQWCDSLTSCLAIQS